MHPNEELLRKFYTSFQNKDYQQMIQCYHPEIEFTDALFDLKGQAAALMWSMLCKNSMDLEVNLIDVVANDQTGIAHWEAKYTFSETSRKVHNIVEAKFEFKDGKIIKHEDNWDFWKWSQMALGGVGRFLGWTPYIKNQVKVKAGKKLENFMSQASVNDVPVKTPNQE